MRKVIIVLFIFMSIYLYTESSSYSQSDYEIPNESIRMRIIANSDEAEDQIIKYNLVENITQIIASIEDESDNIEESRDVINDAVPLIEDKLVELGIEGTVNYGYNYFPEKTYKSVVYDSGDYESLVITIGSGLGENWWCVLFPPLCLLETEDTNLSDLEYSFYVKDIINKYF